MLRKLPFAVLVFALIAPRVSAQDCGVKTDEFSGSETVVCSNRPVQVTAQPGERIWRVYSAVVISPERADMVTVSVVANAEGWNWLSVNTAWLLADGERLEVKALRADSDVEGEGVTEQVVLVMDRSEAQVVAEASVVRAKVGRAELRLGPLPGQVSGALALLK